MTGNIFNKYYLSEYIQRYREQLDERIDKLEITEHSDIENLVERLKSEYLIHPIEIGEPIPSEPKESSVSRNNDWGEAYKKKVYEIFVTINYTGNYDLFYCMPSRSTIVYLDKGVTISRNYITANIVLETLDHNVYNTTVQRIIGTLKSNIPRINDEINPWNLGLEDYINNALQKRKGVVANKHEFMEKIGLRLNPQSEVYLAPSPITQKKIPVPVTETTKGIKKEIIPVLQEYVYDDIKNVLYNVGTAVERKPSIYIEKHEEDLRDIFLLFLETRYDSTSGVGEAFNRKGKTDILLKYSKDGSNIFVAECKFWNGKKKLIAAIDQLLGYLTHRDSKTALIIFVSQKEFSSIIETIKDEIGNHSNFIKHIRNTFDQSFSYEFSLPQDSKKSILIEVMLFHFPK